jgi:hypothetical protein
MKLSAALGGGLAGAVALTVLHEIVRQQDPKAPRMDLLGMNALAKGLRKMDRPVPERNTLFGITMAGDIISNALYYALIGIGKRKSVWTRGAALGAAAGLGGVLLPRPMGLDPAPSNRTNRTRVMTVGWYLFGGLVAAAAMAALEGKRK